VIKRVRLKKVAAKGKGGNLQLWQAVLHLRLNRPAQRCTGDAPAMRPKMQPGIGSRVGCNERNCIMATRPNDPAIPDPDRIDPQSPPELPVNDPPIENPAHQPPELDPVQPDVIEPDRGPDEMPSQPM